jgi:hypothetical protein
VTLVKTVGMFQDGSGLSTLSVLERKPVDARIPWQMFPINGQLSL